MLKIVKKKNMFVVLRDGVEIGWHSQIKQAHRQVDRLQGGKHVSR